MMSAKSRPISCVVTRVAAQQMAAAVEHGDRVAHGVERVTPLSGGGLKARLGLDLSGDVPDEALEHRLAAAVVHGDAALPDPPRLPRGRVNTILERPGTPSFDVRLDGLPDAWPVFLNDEVRVREHGVAHERLRLVAGQSLAAGAHEANRPLRVVLAAVSHARQVAEQGAERTLASLQPVSYTHLRAHETVLDLV